MASEHPKSLEGLANVTLMRLPALQLRKPLDELVRSTPSSTCRHDPKFQALRVAFELSSDINIAAMPHVVSNASIPSGWVYDYRLRVGTKGTKGHHFAALVKFDKGHFTQDHFKVRAAVTYGCLLFVKKSGSSSS